jgi:aminoglycoside 6'-N-acetyltransferase
MNGPTLSGDRVTLRLLAEEELPRLLEMLLHPVVAEWWPGYDLARLRADMFDDPHGTAFAVDLDGVFVGMVLVTEQSDPYYRSAGLDIALDADCVGKGLGTDTLRTIIRHLFDDRGHHRITIDPALSNERAIGVYQKVGFKPIGVARGYEKGPDGSFHDNLLMDMLSGELQ